MQGGYRAISKRRSTTDQASVRRRGQQNKTSSKKNDFAPFVQLIICAAIFLSVFAAKTFFPERVEQVSGTVINAINETTDYKAVFSNFGKAITDPDGITQVFNDIYTGIFGAEGETSATADTTPAASGDAGGVTANTASAVSTVGFKAEENFLSSQGGIDSMLKHFFKLTPGQVEEQTSSQDVTATGDTTISQNGEEVASGETDATSEIDELSVQVTGNAQYASLALPANVTLNCLALDLSYTTPLYGQITSEFGYRMHPIENEVKFHYGLDIAADEGTEIGCFADGKVSAIGESNALGLYIMIKHSDDVTTLYAHCSKLLVKSGETVKKGEAIACVGVTGETTGPHLHFELRKGNVYLNPIYYVSPE